LKYRPPLAWMPLPAGLLAAALAQFDAVVALTLASPVANWQHRHVEAQLTLHLESPSRRRGATISASDRTLHFPRRARTAGGQPSLPSRRGLAATFSAGTNGEGLIEMLPNQLPSHSHRRRDLQGLRERP
jgi:hypothetical protein